MDDEEDIDRFLYGDEAEAVKDAAAATASGIAEPKPDASVRMIDQEQIQPSEDEYEDDDDDDDDDVEFVLDSGEPSTEQQQQQQKTLKVAKGTAQPAIDIDAVGTIGGQHIFDVDLDDPNSPLGLADVANRPWRKPGADITDYFNYGFNEHTWKLYCQKQRMIRGDPAFSSNSHNPRPSSASSHQSNTASFPSFGTQRGEESSRNSRPSSNRHHSRERSVERSSYDRSTTTSSNTRRPSMDRSYQRRRDHSQEESPSRSSRDRRSRRR